jgi:outer membrane protein TolC
LPPPDPVGTLMTWDDAVRLATEQNPDLQSSREAVLNSHAVKMGAYSALYPQISATFSGNRSYQDATMFSSRNYSTSYSSQIALSQTIFNGFATRGNIDQARAELNLAFANMNAEKATISYNLKSAFAQMLYAQKLITLSQNVIEIRQNTARLVKLLYEGGSEDKGAMLLSQANLDQAINALDQALRTRDLSGLQLSVVIGKDLPRPILAEGELETSPLPVAPDYRKLAVVTPAYFQKQAEVDASAAGITIAESGWYPTITAGASASAQGRQVPFSRQGWDSDNHGWSAGFSVSYPIFQGGQTYFNVKAADASFREALSNLRSGTDQAALTLAQSFKSMVDTQDNVRIQQELLEATALRYKIAEANYRNGLMSFQDFNTITDSYVSQQQTCLSSQLSAVIAEANWEQVRGLGAIP